MALWAQGNKLLKPLTFLAQHDTLQPKTLFEGRYAVSWEVAPDAKRFLTLRAGGGEDETAQASQPQLHVVLEWFEEIRRRVGAGK